MGSRKYGFIILKTIMLFRLVIWACGLIETLRLMY